MIRHDLMEEDCPKVWLQMKIKRNKRRDFPMPVLYRTFVNQKV